jgi:hypothetical protein
VNRLESRYRRLLAWYPAAHRDKYEEEMIGVLLAAARSGQSRPGFAESLNLMASGVRARVGSAAVGLADRRWGVASAVAGLVLPVLLALKALRPIIVTSEMHLRVSWFASTLTAEQITMAVAWTATAALALFGWRRIAAGLAWAAVIIDFALTVPGYISAPVEFLYLMWTFSLGVTAAVSLTLAAPLDRSLLRTPSGRAFSAAVALSLGWFVTYPLLEKSTTEGGRPYVEPWLRSPEPFASYWFLGLHDAIALAFAIAAGIAALIGVLRLDAAIRRRFLAILAPVVVLAFTVRELYGPFDSPVVVAGVQWLALVGVPVITFAVAVVLVHRRDRTIELMELGRATQRT